jgi:hypothetical protein
MAYIIRNKYGQCYFVEGKLRLRGVPERTKAGHLTGRDSKHRFYVNSVVTINKNLDNTEECIREITPEQTKELQRLDNCIGRAMEKLNTLYRARNGFINTCFLSGRGVPVQELLKRLKEQQA